MTRLPRPQIVRITCLTCAFGLLGVFASALTSEAAEKKAKGQITKLTVDPAAEQVELFEGIEKGQVEVKIIAKDPFQGNMLFENKTDKPITVKVPDAIVGVPVLKQFGGPNGGGGTGLGGIGGGQNSSQSQQPQPFGGGFGGGGGGFGGGGGGFGGGGFGGGGLGGGFFSIPPEKIVRVSYNSVCLAHGRPEPRPGVNYKLAKVEDYTKDTTLQEVVRMVGTGRLDRQSAQAAAWHLTDNMSWQELANKKLEFLGGQGVQPYFAPNQLFQAQSIVSQATASAKERQEKKPEQGTPVPATIRTLKTR